MRITLTLDDDVAAALTQYRTEHGLGMEEAANEALRKGLNALETQAKLGTYCTPSVSLGQCLIASPDNVAEALALAEGEQFR